MLSARQKFIACGASIVAITAATSANGQERLWVPFSCETTEAGVVARPSHDQSFGIAGGHEKAPFTTCAADDPNRCRTMMLHRFDIDCDGRRVSWQEFFAAISHVTTGQARLDGRRLIVRVRPELRRRAASRFAPDPSRQPFLVEMPDGFAPVRGTVARFDGQPELLSEATTEAEAPAASPRSNVTQTVTPAPSAEERDAKKPTQPEVAEPAKPKIITPSQTTASEKAQKRTDNSLPTVVAVKQRASPQDKEAAESREPTAETARAQTAPSVTPTIINVPKTKDRTESEKSVARSVPAPPAETVPNDLPDLSRHARNLLETAASPNTAEALQQNNADASPGEASSPPSPLSSTGTKPLIRFEPASPSLANTVAVLAVVAAILLCAAAFIRLRRRNTQRPSVDQLEIAEKSRAMVTLMSQGAATHTNSDGHANIDTPGAKPERKEPTLSKPQPDGAPKAAERPLKIAIPDPPKEKSDTPPTLIPQVTMPELPMPKMSAPKPKDRPSHASALIVPKTRQEALAALGIGNNAGRDVIEKVVAGLRRSAQPNESSDEADRARRLQRLEQIETAWHILSDGQDEASSRTGETTH